MDSVISILGVIGLIFVVVMLFNLMIFVHELGHFWAARWRGLYVDRFQIWFGRPLWKKTINGVQWGLGWIPAGGFVSLPQMAPMEAIEGEVELPPDLKDVSPLDRIIVAAAGPLASLLLAFFFAFIVWGVGKTTPDMSGTTIGYVEKDSPAQKAGLLAGDRILQIDGHAVADWAGDMAGVVERVALGENDRVTFLVSRPGESEPRTIVSEFEIPETGWWQRSAMRYTGIHRAEPAKVAKVFPGSPADRAGLGAGDIITGLNGEKLWSRAQFLVTALEGKPLDLQILHADGRTSEASLAPVVPENWEGLEGARPLTGINWASEQVSDHPTPWQQVGQSLRWMKDTVLMVIAPKSSVGVQHLSGPVGIAGYFYDLFQLDDGWKLVLWFAVVLNVNLAVLNMLPLPVVDGGHVVMNLLELILRKPVSGRFLEMIQVGFVFVILGFFLFVTSKDIGDRFGRNSAKLPDPVFRQAD